MMPSLDFHNININTKKFSPSEITLPSVRGRYYKFQGISPSDPHNKAKEILIDHEFNIKSGLRHFFHPLKRHSYFMIIPGERSTNFNG